MFKFFAYRHLQNTRSVYATCLMAVSITKRSLGNHKNRWTTALSLSRSLVLPSSHTNTLFFQAPYLALAFAHNLVRLSCLFTIYIAQLCHDEHALSEQQRNRIHIGSQLTNHLQRMENQLTFAADNGHHEAARKLLIEMILFVPTRCEWLEKKSCCYDNNRKTKDDKAKKKREEIGT